jgi:hypothetical protein
MLKTILVAAVAVSAVSTCSTPRDDAAPEPEETAASSATPTAQSTVAPAPNNSTRQKLDPSKFDLMYVRTTAPECGSVWMVGANLPGNYQWCSDQGEPVAGVRIGPCEVIVYDEQFYAIPGRRITAANGDIAQDPAFARARTSCKRNPAPTR